MKLELCRSLRWKGYHEDLEAEEVVATFIRNRVPYTCLKTCQPFGPDENLCAPELCKGQRECFERSPNIS